MRVIWTGRNEEADEASGTYQSPTAARGRSQLRGSTAVVDSWTEQQKQRQRQRQRQGQPRDVMRTSAEVCLYKDHCARIVWASDITLGQKIVSSQMCLHKVRSTSLMMLRAHAIKSSLHLLRSRKQYRFCREASTNVPQNSKNSHQQRRRLLHPCSGGSANQ